jgi:hypothetical protein
MHYVVKLDHDYVNPWTDAIHSQMQKMVISTM